jgi:RNA polymerase sigma-70 factor (ECF subfamily)
VTAPPTDDAALVAGLKAGDESAYEAAVREHGPRLLAVAKRFLPDEADAQEAVQDAFLSAFRSIERFQGASRLSTWLHRIVVNAALQKLRSKRRRSEASIDDLLPAFTDDGHVAGPIRAWTAPAERLAEDKETRDLVRAAIDRLPETYRVTLLLRDVEGLDTAETAKILGIEENAVRVRLHRARLALRSLLDPSLASRGNGAGGPR